MTREEAVKLLQATRLMLMDGANQPISDLYYALDMAIEALEQTEPTISKMEQVDKDINVRSKNEPTTQTETQNSNLTFEKRKCVDCNFLTYMFGKTWCNIKCENPHDKVCDRFKPKDEPQTDDLQDWKDRMWAEAIVTEPQTDCAWK